MREPRRPMHLAWLAVSCRSRRHASPARAELRREPNRAQPDLSLELDVLPFLGYCPPEGTDTNKSEDIQRPASALEFQPCPGLRDGFVYVVPRLQVGAFGTLLEVCNPSVRLPLSLSLLFHLSLSLSLFSLSLSLSLCVYTYIYIQICMSCITHIDIHTLYDACKLIIYIYIDIYTHIIRTYQHYDPQDGPNLERASTWCSRKRRLLAN